MVTYTFAVFIVSCSSAKNIWYRNIFIYETIMQIFSSFYKCKISATLNWCADSKEYNLSHYLDSFYDFFIMLSNRILEPQRHPKQTDKDSTEYIVPDGLLELEIVEHIITVRPICCIVVLLLLVLKVNASSV